MQLEVLHLHFNNVVSRASFRCTDIQKGEVRVQPPYLIKRVGHHTHHGHGVELRLALVLYTAQRFRRGRKNEGALLQNGKRRNARSVSQRSMDTKTPHPRRSR